MGNRPRTLEHFPRMKPRGDRRRMRKAPSLLNWWWQQRAAAITKAYEEAITRYLRQADYVLLPNTDTTLTRQETPTS